MLNTIGKATFRQINRLSGGTLGILTQATGSFIEARALQAAAAISYYTLFSLFPLLLLLITFATSVLKHPEIVDQILDYTTTIFPTSQALVRQNIQQVLSLRGTVGVVASIGLLWAATTVFVLIADSINLAWHTAKPRNFLQGRLVALLIIVIMVILMVLSLAATTLFNLLPRLDFEAPLWGGISMYETLTWQIAGRLVPWFFIFVMFLSLYRWVPNTKVEWSEAFWGALIATTAWEITKSAFTWYLRSGLVSYQLIYGSLGTVVAFMLWIYLSALIMLFGAHLSGAITAVNQTASKCPTKSRQTSP